MKKYAVTTDLIVHCKVRVIVDAETGDDAINAAADLMPSNFDMDRAKQWRAQVKLKPPKGVECQVVRAYHFEQASGADKARRIGSAAVAAA